MLVARGELDIQSGLELSALTKAWLDTQYASKGLDLKAMSQNATEGEQTISISGGLPALPGTNITMPQLNGHKNQPGYLLQAQTTNPSSIGVHTDTTTSQDPAT